MRITKWTAFALGSFILVGAASASAQVVVVPVRPPNVIVERRGPPPGRGFVWVPGYQQWAGRTYVWVPGQWQRPPRSHAHWVAGRWVRHGHGWYYRPGYWR